jgi:hypothetical protein
MLCQIEAAKLSAGFVSGVVETAPKDAISALLKSSVGHGPPEG